MGSARIVAEESIDHLIPRPPFQNLQFLDESIVILVLQHLRLHEFFQPWRDRPRLYALLRMLQCDKSTMQQFEKTSINDFWLPLDEATFKSVRTTIDWDKFRRIQRLILTHHERMSEAELLATPHVHRHLEFGGVYFEEGKLLGHGNSAQVFQVQHVSLDSREQGSFYACKRAKRGKGNSQRDRMHVFVKELQILRRIKHPHIVRLVTSYTDTSYLAIILCPVADESLKEMLDGAALPLQMSDKKVLLQSFACLISALSYLHTEGIRHKDIKPGNIVLSKGRVYLCDFGVSNDWTGSDPVTEEPTLRTPGYCAPEVMNSENRTDAQDVWSMGRVFCEIFTVLGGKTLQSMMEHIGGDLCDIYGAEGIAAMIQWLSGLVIQDAPLQSAFLRQIMEQMMTADSTQRPKAKQLHTDFDKHWPFVGECCQDAYPFAATLLSHSSSPGVSYGRLSYTTTHGSPGKLAALSRITSNENMRPALSNSNDATLAPDKRLSSPRPAIQNIAEPPSGYEVPPIVLSDRQSSISDIQISAGYSSAESQRMDAWSSGSTTSPRQTPRASVASRADRSDSFGGSSTRSGQLVRWSSGPVVPLQPTPINFSVTCNCAPRQNRSRLRERLILSAADIGICINIKQPTIEITACDIRQNMLRVYESYSQQSRDRYGIWYKTRRLVISQVSDTARRQQCYSFWLPLTDIASAVEENRLTLRWSDCNQWKTSPLGNNKQSCDCIYDPENLNNEITIFFKDTEAAVLFLDNLCAVYNDFDGVNQWHNVEIIDQQRLLAVDIREKARVIYRIACLATIKSARYSTFQMFIHWPDLDLDIRIQEFHGSQQRNMVIRFDQVSTPNYTSSVVEEPWVDKSKVGRCVASELVLGTYSMTFPFESSTPSRIPPGVKQTLEYLTGWTMFFFAPNVQLAKDKLIWDTNYGLSDVILWTRHDAPNDALSEVKITFRHRRARPDYLWRSASVDVSESPNFSLTTAEFAVTHRSRGDMLHTPTMTAVDKKGAHPSSDKPTKLGLQFETSEDLTALVMVFDELQKAARSDSLVKVRTNSTLARVSRDLFRRHSNTSQGTR